MKTVGETLELSKQYLQNQNVEGARRMAEELVSHAVGLKRLDLYLQFDRPVLEKELEPLRDWLKRKAKGEPVEQILGEVEFYNCRIRLNRHVLIPRPETEILVDLVAKKMKGAVLWDVCTGSGCIGLSLKKAFPRLRVILADLSSEALSVARENAQLNEVEVEIRQGDFLIPFRGEKADLVVCNPPYITAKEYLSLSRSVVDFEPKLALVGGERGTEFYERLALELPDHLNPSAQVFLEIGASQGDALKQIFTQPVWARKELLTDWSGRDRFFFLEKQ